MARKKKWLSNRAVGLSSLLMLQMLCARACVDMKPGRLVLGCGVSGEA